MKPLKANFILGKKQIILASLVLILGVAVYLNFIYANSNNDLDLTTALDETQSAQDVENKISDKENAVVDKTGAKVEADAKLKPAADAKKTSEEEPVTVKILDKPAAAKATDKPVDAKATDKSTDAKATGKSTDAKATGKPVDAKTTEKTATKGKNLGDTLLVSSKSIADETYFAMAKMARTKSRDEAIETISLVLNDEKLTDEDKKDVSAKAMAMSDIIEAESRIENLIKAKGFEECVVYITNKNANVVVKTDGLDQDKATQIKNIIVSEGKIAGENVYITEIN